MRYDILLLVGAALTATSSAAAQSVTETRGAGSLPVHRIDERPRIDGNLDEPVWARATRVTDFFQRYPTEGARPTVDTEVLLVHTASALYVGLRASQDQSVPLVATTLRRDNIDQVMQDDQFVVAIDSYNDGRNGFWFSTNPLGVRVDGQFFDEGQRWEMGWDAEWTAATSRQEDGWTAEIEIPFSTLRFRPGLVTTMGMNFFRRVITTNEQLFAPLIPTQYASGTATVSLAQKFDFEDISGGRTAHIKPFAVGQASTIRNDGGREAHTSRDIGLDARYGLTDNLRLTTSVNTDFAQAEVDARQINLSRFSLFFPEKRDFFLEDAGSFEFGIPEEVMVYFSRRIGLARSDDGSLNRIPLLLGTKLTGKAGRAELGVMNVRTRSLRLEPARNFSVARIKYGVRPRSYLGAIVTNVYTVDLGSDNTIGVDGNVFVVRDTAVRGFVARNIQAGGSGSGSGSNAGAYSLEIYRPGLKTSFGLGVTRIEREFSPTTGFVLRPGTNKQFLKLSVPYYPSSGGLRRIAPTVRAERFVTTGERLQSRMAAAGVTVEFRTEDLFSVALTHERELLDSGFNIFRDITVSAGDYDDLRADAKFITKPGRPLSGIVSARAGELFEGRFLETQFSLLWKSGRAVSVSPFYSRTAASIEGERFRAVVMRTSVDYALGTDLSASLDLQYDNASRRFETNVRLNYIVREGSEFFVVYRGIRSRPVISADFDLGRLESRGLIVKATYLFK